MEAELHGFSLGSKLCAMFLNIAKYFKTFRRGCGSVANLKFRTYGPLKQTHQYILTLSLNWEVRGQSIAASHTVLNISKLKKKTEPSVTVPHCLNVVCDMY